MAEHARTMRAFVRVPRAAILLTLALSGCATITTMHPRQTTTPRPLPVAGTDLFDWKGVVHCHSYLSHDSTGTIEEISAAATAARLDFLVMTDHPTEFSITEGTRGRIGDTLFVVGAEIRTPKCGILAFPLVSRLRRWQNPAALVAEANRQGAVTFLEHAEKSEVWDTPGLTGVEIINLHAGALAVDKALMIVSGLFQSVRTVMARTVQRDPRVLARWDEQLVRRQPLAPIGGNDAHNNIRIYGPLGGTIGTYRETFLTLSTHVLAPRMDEASLVEAFRRGRSYVSIDLYGEGSGFDYRAEDAAGTHLPGDTVAPSAALTLSVRTPKLARIRVLRDGTLYQEQIGRQLRLTAPPPGVYRVEAATPDGWPWLFSGSIRVRDDDVEDPSLLPPRTDGRDGADVHDAVRHGTVDVGAAGNRSRPGWQPDGGGDHHPAVRGGRNPAPAGDGDPVRRRADLRARLAGS